MSTQFDSALIESGKSAHLKAVFQNIAESESFDREGNSQLRYSRTVSNELARLIACRVYGKACLEFVCAALVAQIIAGPRVGYFGFFIP